MMFDKIKEDLEQVPLAFNEKEERKFGAIQTFSDIRLSSFRMGIKSIHFIKDRIKEFEDRLWRKGYL